MTDKQIIDLFWNRNEDAIAATDAAYGRKLRSLSGRILQNPEVTFTVRCCLTHYWLEGDVLRWTNGERIDYPVSFTLENINN